jgi:branched-chain amino acid transport system ATP-binding protein
MALLETSKLEARYGDFQALYGIDLCLEEGEAIAIIGANGAGKSTFLRAITGLLPVLPQMVNFDGRPIGRLAPAEIMKMGIAMVPEGRKLFTSLSVEENLIIGAYGRQGSGLWNLRTIYDLFPVLAERAAAPVTALSGGQQQMVAIGRALMSNPRLLLCDEISLVLAPKIIKGIYAAVAAIRAEKMSIVVVEQDIVQAMAVADRVYCFQEGRVTLTGRPAELSKDAIHAAYFGARALQ